jgi:dienelactone hydrolase
MHTEYIDYKDGDTLCEGYLAYDATIKGRRPAIVVCHAWGGQDDFARDKANKLAELGYVGFALDMYGKGRRGSNNDENSKLMQPFVHDRALLDRRANAGAAEIRKHMMVQPDQIGAIGFCFGGMCALDLARSGTEGLKGVCAFHGLLGAPPKRRASKITAKILALHGYDDPMAPPDQMKVFCDEMTEATRGAADWQLHAFGHCVHAFTNPVAADRSAGLHYNADADRRSWIMMKNFFEEVFG